MKPGLPLRTSDEIDVQPGSALAAATPASAESPASNHNLLREAGLGACFSRRGVDSSGATVAAELGTLSMLG